MKSTPRHRCLLFVLFILLPQFSLVRVEAAQLMAGAAKIDISSRKQALNDPLHARALVLKSGATTTVIISIDVVSVGEIGSISNAYLGNVRRRLQKELQITPSHVIINASHCHGVPCSDVEDRTVAVVKTAMKKLVQVKVGVGTGSETRVMENRRILLKDGREVDVRHAYSLPPEAEVKSIGPVDPQIGVVRFDRNDGSTVAVMYNFAVHPIMGVPSGKNTADMTGFSSAVIEDNMSEGTVALFIQGCAGDINPIRYKDVGRPRNAETLGNLLGLSTLKALRKVKCKTDARLKLINKTIELPRLDVAQRIVGLETQRKRLVSSLRGTYLHLKTFLQLSVKYKLNDKFPTLDSHAYLIDKAMKRDDLQKLDAMNRSNLKRYIRNITTMEKITRINTNLDLLRRHQARSLAAKKRSLDVELVGLRVGEFVLTTFPGELTVQIGLNLKKMSPIKPTFVAAYTNGYIYYAPTTKQLLNPGSAQEDSDCMLAPHWQKIYERQALAILRQLK